jgi:hypothetical protein
MVVKRGRPIGCRKSREYVNRRERRSQVASHPKTWLAGQDSNLRALNKRAWRLFPNHGKPEVIRRSRSLTGRLPPLLEVALAGPQRWPPKTYERGSSHAYLPNGGGESDMGSAEDSP